MTEQPLPGRTGVTAAMVDGVLLIVIDEATPLFRAHVAEMLSDLRELFGTEARFRFQRIRAEIPDPRRPCHLQVVS